MGLSILTLSTKFNKLPNKKLISQPTQRFSLNFYLLIVYFYEVCRPQYLLPLFIFSLVRYTQQQTIRLSHKINFLHLSRRPFWKLICENF